MVLLHDAVERIRRGMIERSFIDDRGAPTEQLGVDDVAVPDRPSDIGSRPPDIGRLEAEAPARSRADPNLIRTMAVNRELRLGGGARGRQDIGRLVRLHHLMRITLARAATEELVPREIATRAHR